MKQRIDLKLTILALTLLSMIGSALLSPLPCAAAEIDPAANAKETAELIELLGSDASTFKKAEACYRLAAIGDQTAVPALAKLLAHGELSNYGRHALERIGGDDAKLALREAAGRARGELLVGLLNSLGRLGDEQAVGLLARHLKSDSEMVATAAARSLGRIATPESAHALLTTFKQLPVDGSQISRDAIGTGCLVCAQKLAQQKKHQKTVEELCDTIAASKVSTNVRLAAMHNAIVLRGEAGAKVIRELLRSDDWSKFQVAMRAAREMDVDVTKELVALFEEREASQQVIMLGVLGDLASYDALETIQKAAEKGEPTVRVKAFEALDGYADQRSLPWILEAMFDADESVAQAARDALVRRGDSELIDAAVMGLINDTDKRRLLLGIDLAKRRLLSDAAPRLWDLTKNEDKELRVAALYALGTTTRMNDWPALIQAATAEEESDERKAARAAAKSASGRITRAGSTKMVAAALKEATPAAQSYLFDLLGYIGGSEALEFLVAAAKSDDEQKVNDATRVLGGWMSPEVAPVLYDLTTSLKDRKYKIRTLRGYIRVARYLSMPIGERLDLCERALELADRSQEKMLVLDVLRTRGAPRGMRIAKGLLDDKDNEVMEQAARVIVILARGFVRDFPSHAEQALVPALAVATNDRVQTVGQEILAKARKRQAETNSP